MNAGIVCSASRIGRITRFAAALRPVQTPTTTPRTIVATVATSVAASVSIESCHRPRPMISARQTPVQTVARTPARIRAMPMMARPVTQNGELSSRDCSGLSRCSVTAFLSALVTPDEVVCCTQFVAEVVPLMMAEPTPWFAPSPGNCAAHRYVYDA